MKVKKIVETTTNRGEFNRAYKEALEREGKIRCVYCSYHKYENSTNKWYHLVYDETKNKHKVQYPNWKLVSKNRKQWMKKPIKFIEERRNNWTSKYYTEIKF